MRSIDALVPPVENDNSNKLSENNNATIKAIEDMATTMKEIVESSTSNTTKTLETFRNAFDKRVTMSLNDNVDINNDKGSNEPESEEK
jgi:hypothetical protein